MGPSRTGPKQTARFWQFILLAWLCRDTFFRWLSSAYKVHFSARDIEFRLRMCSSNLPLRPPCLFSTDGRWVSGITPLLRGFADVMILLRGFADVITLSGFADVITLSGCAESVGGFVFLRNTFKTCKNSKYIYTEIKQWIVAQNLFG